MAINLTKGGNINLTKAAPGVQEFKIGLGWDVNQYDGGQFDLDASVALLNGAGKLTADTSFVFYNNPQDASGAVKHSGDNRTGEGAGHDEVVMVNLGTLPAEVEAIRFAVTIHEADTRKQNFGMVRNAFIEVINPSTNEVVARYDLSEDFSIETCMVPGELYKNNGDWKFKAVGAGYGGGLPAYVAAIQ
jgi:tellurium resistance protein TerD